MRILVSLVQLLVHPEEDSFQVGLRRTSLYELLIACSKEKKWALECMRDRIWNLFFLIVCIELLIAVFSRVEREIPVLHAANLTKYNSI